ncbi:hypothetical protein DENSPDRAFT_882425 [Dentipellis sp. KUC8613]|nr:hypothetical protein DENSPDRAFT_882425 [Dentipellis sp. KUC8613]
MAFDCVIVPHAVGGGALHSEAEGAFQTLRAPALHKQWQFIDQAESLGLYFRFEYTGRPQDRVAPSLEQALASHMTAHSLAFVNLVPNQAPASQRQWIVLVARQAARHPGITAILQPGIGDMSTELLTFSRLFSSIRCYSVDHLNLFLIVPVHDYIIGLFEGIPGHYCLAPRLYNGYHTTDAEEGRGVVSRPLSPALTHVSLPSSPMLVEHHLLPGGDVGTGGRSQAELQGPSPIPLRFLSSDAEPQPNSVVPEGFLAWQHLRDGYRDQATRRMSVQAPDTVSAAQSLWSFFQAFANGSEPRRQHMVVGTAQIENATFLSLSAGLPDITVGRGVGDGVVRSVWTALLNIAMAEGRHHWLQVDDGLSTPVLTRPALFSAVEQDAAYFRSIGCILRFSILWELGIGSISPVFLYTAVCGPPEFPLAGTFRRFVTAVSPGLGSRISSWPPDFTTSEDGGDFANLVLGREPLLSLYQLPEFESVPLQYMRRLSREQCTALTSEFQNYALFGAAAASLEQQPAVRYFREGLDLKKAVDNSALRYLFADEDQVLEVLSEMYGSARTVRSARDVLCRLDVTPVPADAALSSSLDFAGLEERWLAAFRRYLMGGVGVERAVGFVRALTGCSLLPPPPQKLRIAFQRNISDPDSVASFHLCFNSVDILLNQGVADTFINADIPEETATATAFDSYLQSLFDDSQAFTQA